MTHHQSGQGAPAPIPKPPRKNPYGDGISKSNQQYDLYEAIRHPNRSQSNRPPIGPSAFDKPLSKQKIIEKEVYQKFEKNNFSLPGPKLQAFSKIFKLLFLLLALPFYMLLFRLPKWIFVSLIPAGIKHVNNYLTLVKRRVVNFAKKWYQRAIYPFSTLWKQLKFLSKRNTNSKLEEGSQETGFFTFIAMGIWWMVRPIYHSIMGVYKTSKTIYFFIKSFPKKIHDFIQKGRQRINHISLQLRKMATAFKNFFSLKLWKAYLSTQGKKIGAYFRKIKHSFYKACSAKFNCFVKAIKTYVNEHINRILNYYGKLKKQAKKVLNSIYLPLTTSIQVRNVQLQSWTKRWSGKWKNWRSNQELKVEGFTSNFGKINKKFKTRYRALTLSIYKKASQIWIRLSNPLVLWIKRKIDFIKKGKYFFLKFSRVGKKAGSYIGTSFEPIQAKFVLKLEKCKPALSLFKETTMFANRAIVFGAGKLRNKLQPISLFLSKTLSNIILDVRITVAWTTILLRHGMTVLGQTAQEIGWF